MSRQYSNRPYIPPRRRVSLQMCDFVSYPTSPSNDTSPDSSSWQLTDPLSCMHQPSTSSAPLPPHTTPNDFSYFQYPPHRQTLDSSLPPSHREPSNNVINNQHVHPVNETQPPCHFHYLQANEGEQTRPLLPLNVVTVRKSFFCLTNYFSE